MRITLPKNYSPARCCICYEQVDPKREHVEVTRVPAAPKGPKIRTMRAHASCWPFAEEKHRAEKD